MHLEIRKTQQDDIAEVVRIYEAARRYMRAQGNMSQWSAGYPSADSLRADIDVGCSYVCTGADGHIAATFFFSLAGEPTYGRIYGGQWLNDAPYGVVHRVASDGSAGGVMEAVAAFCLERCDNLRIDTHADNRPMRRCLERLGFRLCGTILLASGDARLAYHLCKALAHRDIPARE